MSPVDRDRQYAVGLVVIAVFPIIVAAVRALANDWLPVGDNALVALRSGDVFSANAPLLGLASSASLTAGAPLNHPGPLLFDLLAVPVAIFGRGAGTAIGMAGLNCGAVALIAWIGWRRSGLWGVALGTLTAATLAWSMGSELLYDPWQPHGLLLAFLAFLFLVWAVVAGDLVALPVAVAVGSLLMQTHLTYGYLVPALLVVAVVGGVTRNRGPRASPRPIRVASLALAVGLLCWTQPIMEEITTNRGNISRLVEQIRDPPTAIVGNDGALRLTAAVVARPPFWLRHSFSDTFRPGGEPVGSSGPTVDGTGAPATATAAGLLALPIVALLIAVGVARRRRTPDVTAAAVVAISALAVGGYTASRITTNVVGVAPHQFRFLWPIAAFLTFSLGYAVLRLAPSVGRTRRLLAVAVAGALGLVTVANLPASAATGGPQLEQWSIPVQRDLDRQLGAAARSQPILAEWSRTRFLEPFSAAIMAELLDRDFAMVTEDAYLIRQLGPNRSAAGRHPRTKMFYRDGDTARTPRIGRFERIAFHDGLTVAQQRRLDELRRSIDGYLRRHGLRRTPALTAAIKDGLYVQLRGPFTTVAQRRAVFASRVLVGAVGQDLLDVPPRWRERLREYAELQRRADRETVGIFVGPVGDPAP